MDLLSSFPFNFINETKGYACDLHFIQFGKWLKDSEVRYFIALQKGRWYLTMVYVWVKTPLQFICREIDDYESEKKALIYAELFKRGMQKDARGTQKTNENIINFCLN
jgi:hypothetical protein